MEELKRHIREVPDFPSRGINFYDITTLLKNPEAFRLAVDGLADRFHEEPIDKVVGIESRGFIFAPTLAYRMNAGFVPMRKPGKLPSETTGHEYDLEYGSDRLEVHTDAILAGERVLIVDDLIATGGTALAAARLVEELGGNLVGLGFLVELGFLPGRERLGERRIEVLLTY